ncbi:unnamed protein product (macronuclear) [Paramecium tetraurelia]|uniref:HTH psq-type domain-containing protein n=1 Tax=Paramecium tetraurelia TaxID=5888 RepID=A0D382_PARTE|nr:uncharacterized protein GSPATT00012984001 [Paramecium tetraurelia]CAK77499.1 unnamed protein product [Paramecium tetraurelia]|eukprot:XP_001444896.1 hypothetical protein (macronuclear) [Paramecium tetraurelia strain d4-2]
MMKIKKQKNQRSKYKCLNSSERALIIQYIEEYKYSTSHVSLITGHNISTIKAIYQVYKKEGRIQKKEKRDKILNSIAQVQLFVVDDMNEKLINLGYQTEEFKVSNDDDSSAKEFKEQMLKELIQKKQSQILSLLSNQQAVLRFTNDINTILQQKTITNEFSFITPNSTLNCLEKQQIQFARTQNQEKCSNINKIPLMLKYSLNSQILKILGEQHKQMKT